MNRKEVLLDLGKLKDLNCGLGQVSLNYAKEWALQNKKAFDVSFFLPKNFKLEFEGLNEVKKYFQHDLGRQIPLLNPKVDLWHAIHQDSRFMPSRGQKYLLTIHDLNFLEEKSKRKSLKRLNTMQKKVNRADALTFISHFAMDMAKKHLNLAAKECKVIYNGVENPSVYKAVKPDYIQGKQPFLFSIGVLMAKKNFHVLIPMMKHLTDYHLIIAGNDKGKYADELKEMISKEGLGNRIHIPGIISNEHKSWFYQNMTAFVFPSKCEGFGLPVIEAMHLGKPTVLSNYTSLPEIGGEYAAYWNDFEAKSMAEVVLHCIQTCSEERSKAIKNYAKQFTWSANQKAYEELYKKMLDL